MTANEFKRALNDLIIDATKSDVPIALIGSDLTQAFLAFSATVLLGNRRSFDEYKTFLSDAMQEDVLLGVWNWMELKHEKRELQ